VIVRVTVNGQDRELPAGATVATAVELLTSSALGRGVAVAVSGEVVPRTDWEHTMLSTGAQIEVVSAIQGG
jgi:sulfur carrier protein